MASLAQALLPIPLAGQEAWRCWQPPILPLQQHLGLAQRPPVLPPALQAAGRDAQSHIVRYRTNSAASSPEGKRLHPHPLP